MEGDIKASGNCDKDENESSSHSTPGEHKSFAEFAKDKLDSGKFVLIFLFGNIYC